MGILASKVLKSIGIKLVLRGDDMESLDNPYLHGNIQVEGQVGDEMMTGREFY